MLVDLFQRRINIFNVGFVLDVFVAHQVQNDFGHAAGRTVARALKDHVFHVGPAQMFDSLLAQNPGDRIRNVALAATVRPDNGSYAFTRKDEISMVREGLKARDF